MKKSPYKMKGFAGFGNSPVKAKSDAAKNLLKAVPNEDAYEKLSDEDKKGFDKAAKKAGIPTKKSPVEMSDKKKLKKAERLDKKIARSSKDGKSTSKKNLKRASKANQLRGY